MESLARIQQDVYENWDRYWAQATPVDIGTENNWFALRENLPIEPPLGLGETTYEYIKSWLIGSDQSYS